MNRIIKLIADSSILLALFGATFVLGMFTMHGIVHAQPAKFVSVTVTATAIPSDAKSVHICLWKDKEGFPICSPTASHHAVAKKSGENWRATFSRIPTGTYAISGFADLNGDEKLNRNIIGMPKEPIGLSVKGQLQGRPKGRPSFSKAAVTITSDLAYTLQFITI